MSQKIITPNQFQTSHWSGGDTMQLYIYPEDANFSDHDFLFRISSATFQSTGSRFTDFSGYHRYLCALEGQLSVAHNGEELRPLAPYQIEEFSGSWDTRSTNSLDCRDFNLIVREDLSSSVRVMNPKQEVRSQWESSWLAVFSVGDFTLEYAGKQHALSGKNLFLIETDRSQSLCLLQASKPVLLLEIEKNKPA